jgi:hypothetical protein
MWSYEPTPGILIEVFQFAAILSCALFAGAALYVNVAEHPARMECGTELAATVFAPSYRRGAVMQPSLAVVATVCAGISWWLGGSFLWIIGGLLMFSLIPFTLIAILPTNRQLLAPNLDRSSLYTRMLLVRWGRLHAVRTAVALAAIFFFLVAVLSA